MRRSTPLLLLSLLAGPSLACAPVPICEGRTLRILEPDDGESVPAGRVNVVVEVCDFEEDETITLRLLAPVESDYGFILVDDADQRLYGLEVPTLPGTMELIATGDGVVSNSVAFDIDED